ncbi:regulatory iron-sulfur-containing complex subunit RicT [Humidesulfovibrio sp.]|uniref:PSP1 domain-containing protein n=1 Tax=Humidesulfovibrio sp. TaxID=2910988 RepID=UPI0035244C5C
MSQILGIKFSDHGPVCYFASGAHVLRIGQHVLVETDQGQALGRVATIKTPDGTLPLAQPVAHAQARLVGQDAPPATAQPSGAPAPPQSASDQPAPFEDGFATAQWGEPLPEEEPGCMPGDPSDPLAADPVADPFGGAAESSWPPAPADDLSVDAALVPPAATVAARHDDGLSGGPEILSGGPAAAEPVHGSNSPVALFASDQATTQPIPHSTSGLEPISRLATEGDLEVHAENRRLARRAFAFCRGCINAQNLDMKLVDVEVLHDRSKMIFFFTAPNRIDFRELIKSLVREFHTRIELRQIGVRHETQMIGAIGNCGQVCCCRRFLRKFAPVTIKMAKEQNLFLNPAKISGICGRLLCCLSYEQKGYEEFHKQCPKIGKRLQTPIGSVKVLRANFFKKSISVWVEDVGEREFTLEEWKDMLNRQPGDAQPEVAPQEPQGRQGSGRSTGRVSTGRPARPERGARPEKAERPERGERPERPERGERPESPAAAPAGAQPPRKEPRPEGQAQPEGVEGEARERTRPRRKRRKSRGPKPA